MKLKRKLLLVLYFKFNFIPNLKYSSFLALTEGRGEARHEVGLAAICVSKPLLILCQISDSQSYINTLTKINLFDPDEVSTAAKSSKA